MAKKVASGGKSSAPAVESSQPVLKYRKKRVVLYPRMFGVKLSEEHHDAIAVLASSQRVTPGQYIRLVLIAHIQAVADAELKRRGANPKHPAKKKRGAKKKR